jgi:hypothetical protein
VLLLQCDSAVVHKCCGCSAADVVRQCSWAAVSCSALPLAQHHEEAHSAWLGGLGVWGMCTQLLLLLLLLQCCAAVPRAKCMRPQGMPRQGRRMTPEGQWPTTRPSDMRGHQCSMSDVGARTEGDLDSEGAVLPVQHVRHSHCAAAQQRGGAHAVAQPLRVLLRDP